MASKTTDVTASISTEMQQIILDTAKIQFKELMLTLLTNIHHSDDCRSRESYYAQRGYDKDPIDCFDYLCTCGATRLIELRQKVKEL